MIGHGVKRSTFGDGLRWNKMGFTHFVTGKMEFESLGQRFINNDNGDGAGIWAKHGKWDLYPLALPPSALPPPPSLGSSFSDLLYYCTCRPYISAIEFCW